MARIADGVLKAWLDGAVVKATDYKQEREILRIAVNDNYDRLLLKYDKTEVDSLLGVLEADVEAQVLANTSALTAHKSSTDHDERYYPRLDIDGFLSSLKGAGYNNETLASLKADFGNLQTQITNLNTMYSTDAERIAAINDVINQFQIADGNLNQLILEKANKSDVYTKNDVDGTQQVQDSRISVNENNINSLTNRMWAEEQKGITQDSRLDTLHFTVGNSYLKSEVNEMLNGKADKTTTYTKAEIDIFNAGKTVDSEVIQARLGSDGTNHVALKNRLDKMEGSLIDKDRLTQNLVHGMSIFTAALNTPVEFEVQGRTLISLGMSNIEPVKYYVLADKKTWIRDGGREGTLYKGVAKFAKGSAVLVSKADYTSKVGGSVTENPHIAKNRSSATSLILPNDGNAGEISYSTIQTLNGAYNTVITPLTNGAIAQTLFSINIIEHIERRHGRIPAETVSGKVQWIKDNVNRLTANWHGWGSSVGGNFAEITVWHVTNNAWNTGVNRNHTNGTVTKLAWNASLTSAVDANGFMHVLAFTNPSDSITPSQLNTDFIELELELKSTAVLDTRPIVTRIANFEGKQSASLVENPHVYKYAGASSLTSPSGTWTEFPTTGAYSYDRIKTLDGAVSTVSQGGIGIAQQLFSYNLIAEIENNIGRIPRATVAEKVQWLKDNVQTLTCDWNGFGSSVGGNKANLNIWLSDTNTWSGVDLHHTSGTVAKLTFTDSTPSNNVDSNGFIHYLAYAQASDGTTASTINTDYIELAITLKQGTTLHDPLVPLYEVDATEYGNILTTWSEADVLTRFPKVMGSQHLQNVAVIAEGESVIDLFGELSKIAPTQVNRLAENEIEILPSLNSFYGKTFGKFVPNTQYTISYDVKHEGVSSGLLFEFVYTDGTKEVIPSSVANTSYNSYSKTSSPSKSLNTINLTYGTVSAKTFIRNFRINVGTVSKPYTPYNPSYLFCPVKLGQIGDKKDILSRMDGQWNVRKLIEKDVDLSSVTWASGVADYVGYKRFQFVNANHLADVEGTILKYNGTKLKRDGGYSTQDVYSFHPNGNLYVTVSDLDTGFGETYTPLPDEIKAYFQGWGAKSTDANGKPTAWKSLGDGTDAPTQTLAYVSANKAPNFTPYKLSYVLATPQTVNVNHLVEGDIAVSGSTQVEVTSGVIVREKVTHFVSAEGNLYINDKQYGNSTNWLKNRVGTILSIYRNSQKEQGFTIVTNNTRANGNQYIYAPKGLFDATATYEVTYLVLDRHLFTNNATEVKASYSGSIKDVVDESVNKISDLTTQTSINSALLYRLLVQAKGAGWNV